MSALFGVSMKSGEDHSKASNFTRRFKNLLYPFKGDGLCAIQRVVKYFGLRPNIIRHFRPLKYRESGYDLKDNPPYKLI